MSTASALRAEAFRLEDYAAELARYIDASHHHWVALAISGAAADAARGTLHSATDALLGPAQQMRVAAHIVSLYAPLMERIEQLRARALRLAVVPALAEPVSAVLGHLDTLADG